MFFAAAAKAPHPGMIAPFVVLLPAIALAPAFLRDWGTPPRRTGAKVSGRGRNGVIGEVGPGRAAREGSGTVKRKEACTPAPGKLTCD